MGLQDQAVSPGSCIVAEHPQLLLQRLVVNPSLQAHERLLKIRLFPDVICDRRSSDGRVIRTGRRLNGRAQEEVVKRKLSRRLI